MATSRAKRHYRIEQAARPDIATTLWAESEEDAAKVGRLILGIASDRVVTVRMVQDKEKGK